MGAQMLVMSFAGLSMIGLVNRLGVDTAAAYAVSQQLWTYIQMPAMAIGVAVSSMAAQNIGAGAVGAGQRDHPRGPDLQHRNHLVVIVAIILFDRPVMALFVGGDSPAIPIARHIQLISSWTFVMFGATMVLFSTVRANGATIPPLVILAITLFPIRFGFAILGQRWLGSDALVVRLPDWIGLFAGTGRALFPLWPLAQRSAARAARAGGGRGTCAGYRRTRRTLATQWLTAHSHAHESLSRAPPPPHPCLRVEPPDACRNIADPREPDLAALRHRRRS
jgi:Na+-driven multidrug efflux pump